MDKFIAFAIGLFLGNIMGIFILSLTIAAKRREDLLEHSNRGLIDGENDKG